MAEIAFLPHEAAVDAAVVAEVSELVNRAYDVAERGLWRDGVARLGPAEAAEAIARGSLAVARLDEAIVGSICTRMLDPATGWFGALAVSHVHGGRGVGGKLVRFAEERARTQGAAAMQLELLVPGTNHPHTERLAEWYRRLGYRDVGRTDLEAVDPGSVPFLQVPLEVAVMRKPLGS